MRRERRWLVMLAVAAIAAVLGWRTLSSPDRPAGEEEGDRGAEPAVTSSTGLAANPQALPPPAGRPEPAGSPPAPHPVRESRIEGTVTRAGRATPARVELRLTAPRDWLDSDDIVGPKLRSAVEEARSPAVDVVQAGDDGRFTFPGLAPGAYVLRAIAVDGAVGVGYARVRAPGGRDVTDLALEPRPASLQGRVVHADGTPWQGDVLVQSESRWGYTEESLGVTAADPTGRFSISGLPTGRVVAAALAPDGGRVYGAPVVMPATDEYTIVWEKNRVALEGRVLSAVDRAPLIGVEVVGTGGESFLSPTDPAKTGEDGRFRVLVPVKGGVVRANAPGYVPSTVAVGGRTTDVEIVLRRAGRIRGLVKRREDGGPVAGAEVTVLREGEREGMRRDLSARTDAEGRFTVADLAPASYFLVARGAGRVSAAFLPPEAAARAASTVSLSAGDEVDVVLETVPGARIAGTVRDADGAPVVDATVRASRRIAMRTSTADELSWSAYGFESVDTGTQGEFDFPSLVPGVEYSVSASAPGSPDCPDRHAIAGSSAAAGIDLVLPRARWIEVTVLETGTDAAIPGATLQASTFAQPDEADGLSSHFSVSTSQAEGTTDAGGRARLGPLGPGQVHLRAEAPGFAPREANETLVGSETAEPSTATLRLQRAQGISGTVVRADGEPGSGATVWLTTATGRGSASGVSTRAAEDGTFRFEGLGDGDRTVRATLEAEGLGSETIPAPLGSVGLILRLTGRHVVARVLDADGNPVPSAKGMYSYSPASGGWSGPNDRVQNGRLVIDVEEATPNTTGTLTVDEATDGNGQRLPLGPAKVEGVRPGQEVEVRLPRERTIEGRVVGPDGKGVAGARVRAEPVQEDADQIARVETPWIWGVSAFVRTDATGAFRIGQLGEGPHLVAVLPPLTHAPPETLRRDAGTTGVEIKLRPSVSATVIVLDPQGSAVEGARVVAVRNRKQSFLMQELFSEYLRGWSTTVTTGADGRAALVGLDPEATYVLGARGPAAASLADAITDAWRPADVTLRLTQGLVVAGVARDAAGVLLHGASIDCEDSTGVSRTVVTGEDGRFRFTGLAPGTVRLSARFDDSEQKEHPRKLRARAQVPAGSEVVGLRLR